MERIIVARIGEIALKGLNRSTFEQQLARNMKSAMAGAGNFWVSWSQSRFFVSPQDQNADVDEAVESLTKVFGLTSVSPAYVCESEYESIKALARSVTEKKIAANHGRPLKFKVETKRGLKSFPMTSPEISSDIGGMLFEEFDCLTVDVNDPDFILFIEVREKTYVYTDIIEAQGGMPTGSNGKACLLLSGGIDSPVAGYMIGKRGVTICAIHFHSYPYTSERARDKVLDLAKIVSSFTGSIRVAVVPYTQVQLSINDNCSPELSTVIMRRSMMRIAERYARRMGCSALITGESVGQVASQTMQALYCTDNAANMPVFRPLIGMDKMDVVAIARKINTFETSILPYEDCCTVFTPKHPKTRPDLKEIMAQEELYPYAVLEDEAYKGIEEYFVTGNSIDKKD